MRVW